MKAPPISKELLDYLQLLYPDKLPDSPLPSSEVDVRIGHQQVIRHLRHHFDRQNKTVLAPTQG